MLMLMLVLVLVLALALALVLVLVDPSDESPGTAKSTVVVMMIGDLRENHSSRQACIHLHHQALRVQLSHGECRTRNGDSQAMRLARR